MKIFSPLLSLASSAFATTLLLSAPVCAATGNYDSAHNWAGAYAGLHVGGAVGEFTNTPNAVGPTQTSGNVMGGIQGGYNWQRDQIVFGGEGDLSWIPLGARSASTGSFNENWMMTLRARAGYALGRFMPYATVGLALTETESNLAAGGSSSDIHTGLAVGGGLDYFCHQNWSVRGEYLHADAPNETSTINGTKFTGGSGNHIFRVAVNYHFN